MRTLEIWNLAAPSAFWFQFPDFLLAQDGLSAEYEAARYLQL
jgi:hypothetical protein